MNLTALSCELMRCQKGGNGCELCPLSTFRIVLLFTMKSLSNFSLFRNVYNSVINWFDVVPRTDICVIRVMCNVCLYF